MVTGPAAKRYALAGFELARDRNEIDAWERDLANVRDALASRDAVAFLANRKVPRQNKEEFLSRAAGDLSPLVSNLVRLLSSKDRLELLPKIAESFQRLVDEHRGVAHAQVLTAVEMSDDERRALAARLSEMTGKQVQVDAFVEPEILGGLVARIGDQLIDGSTQTKLVALKRRLAGAAR